MRCAPGRADVARGEQPLRRFACVLIAGACVAQGGATAQSAGGDFSITREAIAGGGAYGAAGHYSAVATIAQAAPGTQAGGDFVVRGGFHVSRAPVLQDIFSDGFEP